MMGEDWNIGGCSKGGNRKAPMSSVDVTEAIRKIVDHVTKIPVIANGGSSNNRNSGINTYEGLKQFWKDSGASSIMVAR